MFFPNRNHTQDNVPLNNAAILMQSSIRQETTHPTRASIYKINNIQVGSNVQVGSHKFVIAMQRKKYVK